MQPFLTPDVPPLMAYGFLLAFAGIGAVLLTKMSAQARQRALGAFVVALVLAGSGTVHAAQPVSLAQLVLNPCGAVQPGSWLDYLSGCFLSR